MTKVDSVILQALREIIILSHSHQSFELINVTSVQTSKDLKNCTVYVSSNNNCDKLCTYLNRIAGAIQNELAASIVLRNTPKLYFKYDTTVDYMDKMNSLFAKVEQDINTQNNTNS